MNEKKKYYILLVIVPITFVIGCTASYFIGRGDSGRFIELRDTNKRLTETIGNLREQLERERVVVRRIESNYREERRLIGAALDACGRIGDSLPETIKKMEILVNLVRHLERGDGRDSDISRDK